MTSMAISDTTVRRGLYGIFAGGLLGAAATALIAAPGAKALPDECNLSGIQTAQSSVALSMSTYLQTHPQANQALTDIAKQSPTQAEASYAKYFADNPKVASELKGIQQPVKDLSAQCGIQSTSGQLTDALETF
jgi:hemophore-related protein